MSDGKLHRPRVLFVSAGVGAGHNQAAAALLAGLKAADPGISAERLDALDLCNSMFRLYYAGGYALLAGRLPRTYGFGYRLTDVPRGRRRTRTERTRMWVERLVLRRFRRWLTDRLPALVVNTHFLTPPAVASMLARGATGLRQMVVVTDYHMHRYWCSEGVDRWFVPDQAGLQRLTEFGVDEGCVDITGLPVHPKWSAPLDEAAIRADWDLPAGRPLVLISGGVNFTVGRVDWLAEELCLRLPQAVVMVLAGANKGLLAKLSASPLAQGPRPRLRAIPFTDRIHELVQLSDVVLTKTGAMAVSEILTKGAAAVLLKPVPGQETYNARMMCENEAAVQASSGEEAVCQVVGLLNDPQRLARLRANALRLARPGTAAIVSRILETVNKWNPEER
jgi:processive 1,2-diacylglycerol beta-glucosyltransferase